MYYSKNYDSIDNMAGTGICMNNCSYVVLLIQTEPQ